MFSDQLIGQLSQFIIRPHREVYGLDKLGPKKIIIKSNKTGSYIEAIRQESTILSEGKKIQVSILQPQIKPDSSNHSPFSFDNCEPLSKSYKGYDSNQVQNEVSIFLHTNSGSRLEGLEYSKFLLQNGHIVCLFDYSGSGVSEGDYVSMGLNESKDLANVVKFLQEKFFVKSVNLWGRSMGAVTAVLYAAKHPHNVRKMVLDSPFCSFRELVKEIVNSKTGLPQFLYGTVLTKIEEHIHKKLQVNLMDIDLKQEIVKKDMQKIPIFFLISKDDKLVKPSHVQKLYQLHKGPKKIQYLQGSHNKPRPTQIRQQCAEFLCTKMSNSNSQKFIDQTKKHYINLMSRKYSEQFYEPKPKFATTSMLLSMQQNIQFSGDHFQSIQYSSSQVYPLYNNSSQNNMSVSQFSTNQFPEPLMINTSKKYIKLQQNSAQNTPRDQHSLNKYPNAKISLSQLKKYQNSTEQPQTQNGNMKTLPIGPHRNHIDFKKQSKTMAIQYKNKIKEQINKI